jgi:hypothetical protein
MAILIGVDEAGYGPNYGPLCVAASAWRVRGGEDSGVRGQGSGRGEVRAGSSPSPVEGACSVVRAKPQAGGGAHDLYKLLKKCVARSPDKAGRKIAIADSKALYSPQTGVRQLERGVLAALAVLRDCDGRISSEDDERRCHERVAELLAAVLGDPDGRRHELACHSGDALRLPLACEAAEIRQLASRLAAVSAECGVELVALRARLVYPAEFNALCDEWGSKGAALSHVTVGLVRGVVDEVLGVRNTVAVPPDDAAKPSATADLRQAAGVRIFFDKHGGRNRYAALVQHHFPDSWIEPVSENRNRSRYRWEHAGTSVEAEFRVGCEELLPTALASMTAKYHRELAMRAFNAFWTARIPGLRPTAGYPGDAARFREEIAAVQAELGFAEAAIWRCR